MKYRRYYQKGNKYKFVLNDEQFQELVSAVGFEKALEKDNASIELIPETKEEAKQMFNKSCDNVLKNIRFYLDNLDKIPTFHVNIQEIFPNKAK